MFFVLVYLFVYPLLALYGGLTGSQKIISVIRGGNKIIDYLFMYPFWFGLVFVFQLAILFIFLDVVKFSFSLIYTSQINIWKISHSWIIIILTTLTTIYIPVKIYSDTETVRVNNVEVKIANLPDDLRDFKIVHISDLQADNRTVESKMKKYIEVVNKLEPDIVIFTGDLVTSGTSHIEKGAEIMGKIKTKYGVYACLGDHDYWSDPQWITKSLEKYKITVLENENFLLNIKSAKIYMTLITNVYSGRPETGMLKTLAIQNSGPSLKIFVLHQPSNQLVEFAEKSGYDIFLAGHTHGGQVVFNLFGFKLSPSIFETNYISGQYKLDSMFININNGLGLTLAPIRYNAPSEVTLIRLGKGN
jgi:predicted MPP superfamily phosphohydrolase